MKSKSFTQTLCTLYLAVLFIVYPLFQHDHYYNMGDNKYYFYLISTVIFLILLAISVLTDPARYYKSKKKSKNTKGKNKTTPVVNEKLTFKQKVLQLKDKFMAWFGPKSIVEKFVWAYLLCAIISFIFGIDHYYGFWGAAGWNMGLLVQCLMIACFFVYAKVWEPDMKPFYFSMIGSSVVMFLGIIMRFGIDPLGNYEGLYEYHIRTFVSTIGQTSWYSGYICVIIPAGIALYYFTQQEKERCISCLYTIICFCALIIQDSDSVYLALAGIYLILLFVAFESSEYFIRLADIVTMMLGSFVLMGYIRRNFSERFNGTIDSFSVKIADNKIIIGLFTLFIVLHVVLKTKRAKDLLNTIYLNKKRLLFVRKIIYIIIAMAAITIIAFIPLNTKGCFGEPIKKSFLYFDEMWGNRRGTSWKVCSLIFSDYNFFRKLVGIGPDSLEIVTQYNEKYRAILNTVFSLDDVLSCAHNEYLNHVIEYGLLGGITYIGIFISAIIRYVKSTYFVPVTLAGALCVASYCGHNAFCYQTILCTPFVFIIIGITEAVLKGSQN